MDVEPIEVSETRYGFMQMVILIENNTAILAAILGILSVVEGVVPAGVLAFAIALASITRASGFKKKAVAYRILSLIDAEPEWTLEQVDHEELRENGEVIIYE